MENDDQVTRMLAKRYPHIPGAIILQHLDGPQEDYILCRWHKKVGDIIRSAEVIATFETSSGVAEIEAFEIGVVQDLCFNVGDAVPSGAIVAKVKILGASPDSAL